MALGKQIGEFSLKSQGMTVIDENNISENWEGAGQLEGRAGTVMCSLHANGDETGGKIDIRVGVFFEGGGMMRNQAQGTYTASGAGRWSTRTVDRLEDGRTIAGEGEVDLASRTWKGKIFEWS